jgi:phosphoribosylcarboxyaminoimidazole (NCAIR) mutase
MPGGIPVAAFSIGQSGGVNSVLFAIEILALENPGLKKKMADFRENQKESVMEKSSRLKEKINNLTG